MHRPRLDAIPVACHPPRLTLVMVEGRIPAGFPSPADDFSLKGLDLNDLLITHPLATFFMQVSGWSLVLKHICDKDIVVVNRALRPQHGHVVVALVDNQFRSRSCSSRATASSCLDFSSAFRFPKTEYRPSLPQRRPAQGS